ncbi:hypothetical protein BCO71171_05046 [Burkholderia contaminans]|uniref:Uncharacterized protein n=1 Tax=Burkholderia contaminans TaxID=488447 RepID=A0A6P3AI66_9BURK|nr:hypothetical protein BCO71171_05046 [Burkholderia contaminans]
MVTNAEPVNFHSAIACAPAANAPLESPLACV